MTQRLASRQLTKDEAIALAKSGWWEGLSPEKIAQFQLSQKKLCMDFSAFHEAVEKVLGRPVWTHEFADTDRLWDELHEHRIPPTMEEIIAMLPVEKTIIINTEDTII